MNFSLLKKILATSMLCNFYAYASEDDRINQLYRDVANALIEIAPLGTIDRELVRSMADDAGLDAQKLIDYYNAILNQASAAVGSAPVASFEDNHNDALYRDLVTAMNGYIKGMGVSVEDAAQMIFEDNAGVNVKELVNRYNAILNQAARSAPATPAAPVSLYSWEKNPALQSVQGNHEAVIDVPGVGKFNIYNVLGGGHCGLYAINTTRAEVLAAAGNDDHREFIDKLRGSVGECRYSQDLIEIGQLVQRNVIVIVKGIEGVMNDSIEPSRYPVNPQWPTYYVFDNDGHFKVAAPVGNELLNKYGQWKQSRVSAHGSIPEGNNIDYDKLDNSQTLGN